MNYVFLFLLLVAFNVNAAVTKPSQPSVIHGPDSLFSVSVPENWTIDHFSGRPVGLSTVFYRKGESWKGASAVMYTNFAAINKNHTNINELIEFNLAQVREKAPNASVAQLRLLDQGGRIIRIMEWKRTKDTHEAVAYIRENNAIVLFALTSKNRSKFEESLPALYELAKSYKLRATAPQFEARSAMELKKFIKIATEHRGKKGSKGEAYETLVTKGLFEYLTEGMRKCTTAGKTAPENLDIILQISSDGIAEAAYWSDNQVANCLMRAGLLNWEYPNPPLANFHYHLNITSKQ